jgi:hypothetical protein
MGLIDWLRRLLHPQRESSSASDPRREERLKAALEAEAARAEAAAHAQQFPRIPPGT